MFNFTSSEGNTLKVQRDTIYIYQIGQKCKSLTLSNVDKDVKHWRFSYTTWYNHCGEHFTVSSKPKDHW